MGTQAITFDFHNTIAACPEWFELEVRGLPSAFLGWWAPTVGVELPPSIASQADARYRELRQEIMAHGNELPAEACLEHVFRALHLAIPEETLAAGVATLMREALRGVTPIPGAVETIWELHRNGTRLGIVSSAVYHPFLEWTLDLFGIRHVFSAVVTSASAGFYKSRPEIYFAAAQRLGVAPSDVVHVGDSMRFDVGGAARAGMGTVWLRPANVTLDDQAFTPDLTIDTLEHSAPLIQHVFARRGNGAHDRQQ